MRPRERRSVRSSARPVRVSVEMQPQCDKITENVVDCALTSSFKSTFKPHQYPQVKSGVSRRAALANGQQKVGAVCGDDEVTMGSASKALYWCGKLRVLVAATGLGLSLAACATVPAASGDLSAASPRYDSARAPSATAAIQRGGYKLGAPYQAAGLWYVPAEDPTYDETGLAGAYGDNLQGKFTANGELFDASIATGAHATLPMPAIVEVTNLENGRSLRVRLNDRGANKPGRVIDLSRGATEQLGFSPKGTAKVRVRYVGPARLDHPTEPLFLQAQYPIQNQIKAPPMRTQPPAAAPPAPMPKTVVASSSTGSAWASAEAAGAKGSYAVQAGAFSDPARAEQVAQTLAKAGAAAVRPVQVSGRQLYRVVVGSWIDQGAADAARAQVAEMGFGDARIIRAF